MRLRPFVPLPGPPNHSVVLAPFRMGWRHFSASLPNMPSIQVKDVPEEVHAVLRRRAAAAGQSLQEYLLGRLREEAENPTVEELFARVEHRTGGRVDLATAADVVQADRDAR